MKEKFRKFYLSAKKAIYKALNTISNVYEEVKNSNQELTDNLEENASKFIVRCFTIGVDAFVACTTMSIILSLFGLVKWQISIMKSIEIGTIFGAIILGAVTIISSIIFTFIPAKKIKKEVEERKNSRFEKNLKENAYRIIVDVVTTTKFTIALIIIAIFCTLMGLIAWSEFLIGIIIFSISLFGISGIYLFGMCIIKGVMPTQDEIKEFLEEVEISISNRGA